MPKTTVEPPPETEIWEVSNTPNGLYVLHEGLPVAAIEPGEYAMKDARLIAAAPDMLAALTEVEKRISAQPFSGQVLLGIDAIREAIAKAKGIE